MYPVDIRLQLLPGIWLLICASTLPAKRQPKIGGHLLVPADVSWLAKRPARYLPGANHLAGPGIWQILPFL
jgi:hypothetical protein